MRREFLSSLGLDKGTIDTVLDEHSRDVCRNVRRQNRLQRRIKELESRLKGFEIPEPNVEELRNDKGYLEKAGRG